MRKYLIVFLLGLSAGFFAAEFYQPTAPVDGIEFAKNPVGQACLDFYKRLHKATQEHADALRSGKYKTESGSASARSERYLRAYTSAFEMLAKQEAEKLQGHWTAEYEAEVLESHFE